MNNFIKSDLYRYGGLEGFNGLIKGFFIPGFRYSYFLRKAANSRKWSFSGILFRILLKRYSYKYGIQIPPATKIGKGFYIGHFGNIVVNSKAIIGNNCNIAPGVTIGQTSRGLLKGAPCIGDSVWIGTNAVIVGKIQIGNNVLIAPGTFVNFDVPDDSLVIGTKSQTLSKKDATEGQINFKIKT